MSSDYTQPLNLGSDRMISINDLALLVAKIAGKQIQINNVIGPTGVMGRNSHNLLIKQVTGWEPADSLEHGIEVTYRWISSQV